MFSSHVYRIAMGDIQHTHWEERCQYICTYIDRCKEIVRLGSGRLRARTNGLGVLGVVGALAMEAAQCPVCGSILHQGSTRRNQVFTLISGQVFPLVPRRKLKSCVAVRLHPWKAARALFYCCFSSGFWSGFCPCLPSRQGRTPIWLAGVSYLISPEGSWIPVRCHVWGSAVEAAKFSSTAKA